MQILRPAQDQVQGRVFAEAQLVEEFPREVQDEGPVEAG